MAARISFLPCVNSDLPCRDLARVLNATEPIGRNKPLLADLAARGKPDIAGHLKPRIGRNARFSRIDTLFRLDIADSFSR